MISTTVEPYNKDKSIRLSLASLCAEGYSPISLSFNSETIGKSQDGFFILDHSKGTYSIPYEIDNKLDIGVVKIYYA